jgi:predicted transcriptional regulator of viral defense system
MARVARRPLVCGEVHVQFVARLDLESTAVVERRTPRGPLRVASAASTALELVGYAERCGGLDNVTSVLAELGESLDRRALVAAARSSPISWVQRLGYLLDLTRHRELADALAPLVAKRARVFAPLVRSRPVAGTQRLDRWRLSVNAAVEPDL